MAAAIVVGAGLVGLAGGRFATSRQSSEVGGQSDVPTDGTSWADVGDAAAAGAGDAAAGLRSSPGGTEGAQLYALHCASCHGVNGEGQPNWKVTGADGKLPAPPHDQTGHTWHHPDGLLLQIIADGGQIYSPNTGMPGFRDKMSPDQMSLVLKHIKGMWGPDERTYQAEVSAESLSAP